MLGADRSRAPELLPYSARRRGEAEARWKEPSWGAGRSGDGVRLACPSCGAALKHPAPSGTGTPSGPGDDVTATCAYCGGSVTFPARPGTPSWRPAARTGPAPDAARRPAAGRRTVLIGLVLVALGAGSVALWSAGHHAHPSPPVPAASRQPSASPSPRYATPLITFGGEGIGPGRMADPRSIAVEGNGDVWVGDLDDGRVQQFDAAGRFRRAVMLPADRDGDHPTVTDLAADAHGHVYVAGSGTVYAFATASGRLLWRYTPVYPETAVDELAVDPNGVLYGLASGPLHDELVRFSAQGTPLKRWPGFVTKVGRKDPAMGLSLAVDGLGRFFVLSAFGNRVYCYDRNGAFVDAFGEHGDERGQFNAVEGIAVDGRGRLHVINNGVIDVFDTSGRYLHTLPTAGGEGTLRDLAIDRHDVLYAVTSAGLVREFRLAGGGLATGSEG